MTAASSLFARLARLPAATATDVVVESDLETKVPDGTVLLSDRWYSSETVSSAPVVLIRSPYGRRQFGIFGRLFAERGYQVVIQSTRGTFGSGTPFVPFHHERADGLATMDWIAEQPWWTGSLATFGPSYLGMTQWAVAGDAPDFLKVMAMQVTASNVRDAVVYPGGSFSLETGAVWVQQMLYQELRPLRFAWKLIRSKARLALVYSAIPLNTADQAAYGQRIDYYQDWLVHDRPGDPYWNELNYSHHIERVPPTSHVAGWYDLFLPVQLRDFSQSVAAGRQARIVIGPWTHTSPAGGAAGLRDALDAFDEHLRGIPSRRDQPVRLFVMGSDRWVDLDEWPPPSSVQRWHLQPGRDLSSEPPAGGRADRYLYDPADPTPSLGGATLDPFGAGSKDQQKRESRSDVITYTSRVLQSDLTVAGNLTARVWTRSSRPHFDLFVRLCDVDPKGRSRNVCDGIIRVEPGSAPQGTDGVTEAEISMWPTAHTFRGGHRVRLQVSSAAHPLFARNTGSGEPLATASHLFPSDVEIFHDTDHPSHIDLPVSRI